MAIDPRRERILRRLLRILDISRDLERNLDDAEFHRQGGKIYYIYDENIFELFVRPWRHHGQTETFHADLWLPSSAKGDYSVYRAVETQSALVAAEYLFEGNLPGSKSPYLYLTDHHRWELANRVGFLLKNLLDEYAKLPASVETALHRKLVALHALNRTAASRDLKNFDRDVGALPADLSGLRDAGAGEPGLDRFRVARVAADALAADHVVEPIEQLRRLLSPLGKARIRSIQEVFRPTLSEAALQERQASGWRKRLEAELESPAHEKRVRDDHALKNDSVSLTYVQWAAAKAAQQGSRVVFVTGDSLLFDAYRRWHTLRADFLAPFILRRATQYAPIFNWSDARSDALVQPSDISNSTASKPLSGLLQEGMEASLLALSLVSIGQAASSTQDPKIARERERYALKLTDQAVLSEDVELQSICDLMTPEWLEAQEGKIREIRAQLQATQRAAIGASLRLLSKRMNNDELVLAEDIAGKSASEVAPALNRYITRLLDFVVRESLEIWLPLAADFVQRREVFAHPKGERTRIPFTVELRLPDGTGLWEAVSAWWDGDQSNGELSDLLSPTKNSNISDQPALVFAIAASLALVSQLPNEAERFADLAVRSNSEGKGGREEFLRLNVELTLLHCLTLRFQIPSVGPRPRPADGTNKPTRTSARETYKQILKISEQAKDALAQHLAWLELYKPFSEQKEYADLLLRYTSEEASLNLFAATAGSIAVASGIRGDLVQDVPHAFAQTLSCLRQCYLQDDMAVEHPSNLRQRIRRQYIPNVAAMEVARALSATENQYRYDESLRFMERRLFNFMRDLNGTPPLLKAELAAFQVLAGRRGINFATEISVAKRSASQSLKLPMDIELIGLIAREFGH